jgi:tRNA A-37 threonylcarbamoyl transferase component Bud32
VAGEASPVHPGEVLAGKYRVERVLGSGGMGVVVAATHVDLGQRVALKFLLPQALSNPEAASRFLREARAAVKIDSEHVARVIDVGRLENGAPYMVMEYLEGHDLSDHSKGSSLPVEDAIDFVLQACEAMAVAHSSGIIHRDLKPANLFLAQRPDGSPIVKVLDFGISKVTEADKVDLTQTSAVMGSPLYMSPEQMKSARRVDARTDIWSLGAIAYELLAGEPPFDGETLGEVFAAVMTAEPLPLRQRRPEVPERLERVVLHALEKDPSRRFGNVAELAAALSEFAPRRSRVLAERAYAVLSRAGIASSPAIQPEGASRPPPAAGATNTSWEDAAATSRRGPRTPIVLGLAAVMILAGLGAAFALRGARAPVVASESARPASAVPASPPVVRDITDPLALPEAPAVVPVPASAALSVPVPPVPSAVAPPLPVVRRAALPSPRPAHAPEPKAATPPSPPPAASPPSTPKRNPLNIEFK